MRIVDARIVQIMPAEPGTRALYLLRDPADQRWGHEDDVPLVLTVIGWALYEAVYQSEADEHPVTVARSDPPEEDRFRYVDGLVAVGDEVRLATGEADSASSREALAAYLHPGEELDDKRLAEELRLRDERLALHRRMADDDQPRGGG